MTTTQAAHSSADEYTPTTGEIREWHGLLGDGVGDAARERERLEEFDRWLAAHDREVAAEAWEEGNAMHFRPSVGPNPRNPYREQEA